MAEHLPVDFPEVWRPIPDLELQGFCLAVVFVVVLMPLRRPRDRIFGARDQEGRNPAE